MRFNLAMLYALVATGQLAMANPEPKWNDKGPEAGYKFGAVACAVGALVCNSQGQTVAAYGFASGGICCSSAAAAVTASQTQGWGKAVAKLGEAAKVVKGGVAKAGTLIASCSGKVCKMVTRKAGQILPKREVSRYGRRRAARRSIDGPERMRPARRSIEGLERKRLARRAAERRERARLARRYADSL